MLTDKLVYSISDLEIWIPVVLFYDVFLTSSSHSSLRGFFEIVAIG
jgi:hypothetical protein